jgi:hypothetical protein
VTPPRARLAEQRRTNLRTTLGFLQLPPTEAELVMLHRVFDSWSGLGQLAVGLRRQGLWLSLTHVSEDEWRCVLMGDNPLFAPRGFGVAKTPGARCRWPVGRHSNERSRRRDGQRRVCALCGIAFAIVIPPGDEDTERDRLCHEAGLHRRTRPRRALAETDAAFRASLTPEQARAQAFGGPKAVA